jgi:hypothetical protein
LWCLSVMDYGILCLTAADGMGSGYPIVEVTEE